jgi:hypothetical protein
MSGVAWVALAERRFTAVASAPSEA